jgi:hypothetical protein
MGWDWSGNPFLGTRVLPQELKTVLQRLDEMYGENLRFLSDDEGYLNFYVWNKADDVLFHELENNKEQLFGHDLGKFQILRPYGRSGDRGVFLRYLDPQARSEFQAGFSRY